MLESQADIDKPKCDRVTQGTQVNSHTFTNIDEASSFWRSLWEEKGSGDTEAEWTGTPNDNFRENICSEDDLRSRIFGTFVVKFLACLPLLGLSNI